MPRRKKAARRRVRVYTDQNIVYLVGKSACFSVDMRRPDMLYRATSVPDTAERTSKIRAISISPVPRTPSKSILTFTIPPGDVTYVSDHVKCIKLPVIGFRVQFPERCEKPWKFYRGARKCSVCGKRRAILTGHTVQMSTTKRPSLVCPHCPYELFTAVSCRSCKTSDE